MKILLVQILGGLCLAVAIGLLFIRKEGIRDYRPEIIAGLSLLMILLLICHQWLANGFWFRWRDFWHHEMAEGAFAALALGLLLGKYLVKR